MRAYRGRMVVIVYGITAQGAEERAHCGDCLDDAGLFYQEERTFYCVFCGVALTEGAES